MGLVASFISFSQNFIEGKVSYNDEFGVNQSLIGVSIFWENTSTGTLSDSFGRFKILRSEDSNKLIFKYIGFDDRTIIINDDISIDVLMMESQNILDEVIVDKKKKTLQKSYFKTQNITNVSSEELLKAACCNISESFETNPSIDVNYSNAITGTKQVKMLGLESPYLLITEENIPMIRGASQIYGLSFIPGTWVESMQITKGTGSVTNGFESISGQINVELNKPFSDSPFFINIYSNNMGRNEINLHSNKIILNLYR